MKNNFQVSLGILLVGLLVFTAIGSAQVTTAKWYGTVTDSTGAVIPGVAVSLEHDGTGTVTTAETSATGNFAVDFLRVGAYTLTIEATGFKKFEGTGYVVTAGQTVNDTYVLEIGEITETVTVESSTPQIQTAQAEQLQTFNTKSVTELPLSRRNFTNLLKIGTGVTPVTGGSGSGVRMNGLGRNGTAFAVDGGESSSSPEGRGASAYQGINYIDIMSIEAIGEVQTVKGIVPAEYGNLVSGQVQIITKSGTNDWHGSLFENFQADDLNSRDPFLSSKQPLTYNQFGGSIGGPIKKNKVFIYAVYEGYRESSFRLVQDDVPTASLRAMMVAAQPTYAEVLDLFPLPNQPLDRPVDEVAACGADGCTGFFTSAGSNSREDNHMDIKGDIRINDTQNLALTYVRGRPNRFLPRIFLNGANDRDWLSWQEKGVANYTIGGSDWTSETRFSYNLNEMERWDRYFRDGIFGDEEFEFDKRLPRFSTDLGWGGPGSELFLMEGYVWSLGQKFAKHVGNHSFKFGSRYMKHCCMRTNPENPVFAYRGGSPAATVERLLIDRPSEVVPTYGSGKFAARMFEIGAFVQDDWRVNSRLTLNMGVRYDFFSNLVASEFEGNESGFYNRPLTNVGTFEFGALRDTTNPYEHDSMNLAPRFGFAYKLDQDAKTVLRGGFGAMFSNQMAGAMWQSVGSEAVPFRTRFTQQATIDELGLKFGTAQGGTSTGEMRAINESEAANAGIINTFSFFNPGLSNPYAMHFNVGIQRQLARDLVLETAYVGNLGRKFLMHRRANNIDRFTGLKPNPNLRITYYVDHSQTSNYNSWQTSLKKRYARNFMMGVHYTWSKAIATEGGDVGAYYQGDNDGGSVQDYNCISCEYGPASGDQTHYLASDWVWDLPSFAGKSGAVRHILGGWQMSGILTWSSGQPILRITQGSNIPNSRPDYIGGEAILDGYERGDHQYLNPAAFAKVPITDAGATTRPGKLGKGAVRLPSRFNTDFSLGKNIQVGERVRVRLRADMFNVFNNVNLGNLRTSINSSTFGRLRNTAQMRVVQLNLRLTF